MCTNLPTYLPTKLEERDGAGREGAGGGGGGGERIHFLQCEE